MNRTAIIRFLRNLLPVGCAALTLASCQQEDKLPPLPKPEPEKNGGMYVAGSATTGLKEEYLKLAAKGETSVFNCVLDTGELYFRTVAEDGTEGKLYFNDDASAVVASGKPLKIERGYYVLEIKGDNSFRIKRSALFGGEDVYLSGGDAFYPRTHKWDAHIMPAMTQTEPFVYTYTHHMGTSDNGTAAFRFFFQKNHAKSAASKNATGNAEIYNNDQEAAENGITDPSWQISAAGDYTITYNMMSGAVTITPAKFYPDKVAELFVIGNIFGNSFSDPASLENMLTEPIWVGETATDSKGATAMTRSTDSPDVYSITADLKAKKGGFWFLLQRQHSVPSLIKATASTCRYFFTQDLTDKTDTEQAAHWTVAQDGNYTISVNIRTNQVTVTTNSTEGPDEGDRVIPEGSELYVAGTVTTGLPEHFRLMTYDAEKRAYIFDKLLNKGDLHFVATKNGTSTEFYFNDEGLVDKDGNVSKGFTNKGFYNFEVDAEDGTLSMKKENKIDDCLWMHGGPALYPRYGQYSAHLLTQINPDKNNPFVFEYHHHLYSGSVSFFGTKNNAGNDARRFGDAGDGRLGFFTEAGVSEFDIPGLASDVYIKLDLLHMTYAYKTDKSFYPDHVTELYVIGNTFFAVDPGWSAGYQLDSAMQIFNGDPVTGSNAAVAMTPDPQNPQKFSITADLTVAAGGFWFTFQRQGSLPSLLRNQDNTGRYFKANEPTAPDAATDDFQVGNRWTITEDGNYTITVDVKANTVNIKKN